MVIEGLSQDMLIGDIDRVRIYDHSGLVEMGENANVKITLDDQVILEERYYPVNNEIIIRELKKVILDSWQHEELKAKDSTYKIAANLEVDIVFPDGTGISHAFQKYTVYYCSLVTDGMQVKDHFLTRFSEKEVYPDSIELVAFTIQEKRFYQIDTAFLLNGVVAYAQDTGKMYISRPDANKAYVFLISMKERMDKYKADSLIYVIVRILDENDNELDRVTFNVNYSSSLLRSNYLYRNPFGIPEVLTFQGKTTETFDPQNQLAYTLEGYMKVSDDPLETYKVRTGSLSEELRESVKDFLRSFDVYRLTGDQLGDRMTVIESEAERTFPSNSIVSYTLTLRKSSYQRDKFHRKGFSVNRIFDKSFDNTYE